MKGNWINSEKTIYLIRYSGMWQETNIQRSMLKANNQILEIHHGVVILVDLTESESIPSHLMMIAKIVHYFLPKNVVCMCLFGGDLYLEIIADLVGEIQRDQNKFVYADSYSDALNVAHQNLTLSQSSKG